MFFENFDCIICIISLAAVLIVIAVAGIGRSVIYKYCFFAVDEGFHPGSEFCQIPPDFYQSSLHPN